MASLKQRIKSLAPVGLTYWAKTRAQRGQIARSGAAEALAAAQPADSRLDLAELRALAAEYPAPDFIDWEGDACAASSAELGVERVQWMRKVLGHRLGQGTRCVELGAGDGAVTGALAKTGADVLAVDIQRGVFDEIGLHTHVPFLEADVEQLDGVADNSVDLVYSFDSVEHFGDPEAALAEALRITRPGGFVYLRFGPLYDAPDGKHLGDRLGIPYAGVLFENETIDAFLTEQGREVINHEYCNHWPLARYRELFTPNPQRFTIDFAYDHLDLSALELIARYPEIFRRRADTLDAFLVNVLELCLRKPA